MNADANVVFSARLLVKSFRAGIRGCSVRVRALCGVSIALRRRELTVVAGPPGSGKTTLLLSAAGLLRPDTGRLEWWSRGNRDGLAYLAWGESERWTPLLARALARRPALVLCDGLPPVATSDHAIVCQLLRRACTDGAAVAVALRDPAPVGACGTRVLTLDEGRVVGDRWDRASRMTAVDAVPRHVAESRGGDWAGGVG
ncbi:MAG: hypothetical protein NVS1B4_09800 [Gemmatimonadaceae bacterium]